MNNTVTKTDWKRLESLSDDEIDTSDIPELDEVFFKNATLRNIEKQSVTLKLDDDNEIDYSDTPITSKPRKNLRVHFPNTQTISIEKENIKIDADVLAWFKSHESNYKESINQLLREYITKNELAR